MKGMTKGGSATFVNPIQNNMEIAQQTGVDIIALQAASVKKSITSDIIKERNRNEESENIHEETERNDRS